MYAIDIILPIRPLSMTNLSAQHIKTIKDAAKKLTGAKRRAFQAQVAIDYLNSKPHLAEMSGVNYPVRVTTITLAGFS